MDVYIVHNVHILNAKITNKTMKLKVKYINKNCKIEIHGDWIDLKSSITHEFTKNLELKMIPLGVCIELPKYFEAIAAPRSSTYKTFRLLQTNSPGVIDYKYKGDEDQWHFPCIHMRKRSDENITLHEGDRICQFRIQPSQFAPWWVKLRWLFTSKFKIKEVELLGNINRGGLGSTNKK